ncbi:hypothetical protein AB3S75_000501 [Citrus x aurantiifolia]
MTTAFVFDNMGNPIQAVDRLATPFDFGPGHLNPDRGMSPGPVYEFDGKDVHIFLCSQKTDPKRLRAITGIVLKCQNPAVPAYQLNLPSIAISNLDKPIRVNRTVTFKGKREGPQVFRVSVEQPEGVNVRVEPEVLNFSHGETKLSFTVQFTPSRARGSGYTFGSLNWRDGEHVVRSPIAVAV